MILLRDFPWHVKASEFAHLAVALTVVGLCSLPTLLLAWIFCWDQPTASVWVLALGSCLCGAALPFLLLDARRAFEARRIVGAMQLLLGRFPQLSILRRLCWAFKHRIQGQYGNYPVFLCHVGRSPSVFEGFRLSGLTAEDRSAGWLWSSADWTTRKGTLHLPLCYDHGIVVAARCHSMLAPSLELLATRPRLPLPRIRVFTGPIPGGSVTQKTGDPDFDETLRVHLEPGDEVAVERWLADGALRAALVAAFQENNLLLTRRNASCGYLNAPFDGESYLVVQWIPVPEALADVLSALDRVVRVAEALDQAAHIATGLASFEDNGKNSRADLESHGTNEALSLLDEEF